MAYAPRHHAERSLVASPYFNHTTPKQPDGYDSPISPLPRALLSQKLQERVKLERSSEWVRSQSSHSSFPDASPISELPSRTSYTDGGRSSRKSSATLDTAFKEKRNTRSTSRSLRDVERHSWRCSNDPFRTPGPPSPILRPSRRNTEKSHEDVDLNAKALKILVCNSNTVPIANAALTVLQLFLSGPAALLSFFVLIWTLLAFFVVIILQPFRLCTRRRTVCQDLVNFLSPLLSTELRLIYSSACTPETTFSAPSLFLTNLLAPVIAIGVMFASWVAAFFWVFSAILGDPGPEKTKNHNDGKASVLGLRTWWERWLCKSLR